MEFQHSAARRRLGLFPSYCGTNEQCFNTQPPEGGWERVPDVFINFFMFQHSAARRRLGPSCLINRGVRWFQHSAARRRLGQRLTYCVMTSWFQHSAARRRLVSSRLERARLTGFQHSAARRRLDSICATGASKIFVSTLSRPKAAGASLKSLAPSGFAAPISLSSQEKREREYNTALSVTPAFAIS